MSSTYVQTTLDYLEALKKYSGFDVQYVHVTHGALINFDLGGYDIVFHNYCARLCFEGYVSESYRQRLRAFPGIKVLAVQDEYDRTDTLRAAIKDLGFDIVLTCVPQDSLEYVYPKSEFPGVEFITVFTGYVPDDLDGGLPPAKPLAERSIFIGYRGRDIGGRYGRLSFDKFEIGRRMQELCAARGIATDIAMDEASRIYGKGWFDFIGDCRVMLGSESGSNVFDFDGSIEDRFREMAAANGGVPPSYADFLPIVAPHEGAIEMGQISPRIFECAIMRTPMVLFKGRYSDAIEPDEHYIALEKDFSNIDSVLQRLGDLQALEAMAERAFFHLVGSGRFSYQTYCTGIAAAIERRLAAKACGHGADAGGEAASLRIASHYAGEVTPERPTTRPMAAAVFQMRHEFAAYSRDLDQLMRRFDSERSVLASELQRLHDLHNDEIGALDSFRGVVDIDENPQPRHPAGSEFARLLIDYDSELAILMPKRVNAGAAFEAALSGDDPNAVEQAFQVMLEIDRSGYFALVEWLRRLDETYRADRTDISDAYLAMHHLVRATAARVSVAAPVEPPADPAPPVAEAPPPGRLARIRGFVAATPVIGLIARHVVTRLKARRPT